MRRNVEKAQEITAKVEDHIRAAQTFLSEGRGRNALGVYIERFPVIANLQSAKIEIDTAIETLMRTPYGWPGPADYDEA